MPTIRVYERVSSRSQKTDAQHGDLQRWADYKQGEGFEIVWYKDRFTGKSLDRPGFKRLQAEVQSGDTVACWRLDRLGRTTVGLVNLFEGWRGKGVNFYSLKDSIDLSTASGRLVLNMLISIAAYETELRAERVEAAQATRKARGEQVKKPGPPKGRRLKVNPEQAALIQRLKGEGKKITVISRTLKLSRPTVYSVLEAV